MPALGSHIVTDDQSVIDLHCHVLPGIDDGPRTFRESLELARIAGREGTHTIVATPHVSTQHPNDSRTIHARVEDLNRRLEDLDVRVRIEPGAEIAVTHADQIAAQEIRRLTLGGGEWLLIEPPFTPVAMELDSMILAIMNAGHRVLIAHPERCPALRRDPRALGDLVRAGALTSVTSGSLVGRFGEQVRRFAVRMLDEHVVHNLTSDAHDTVRRRPTLAADAERARLGALTEWLTVEVPSAILGGTQIPARPSDGPRHGGSGLLRRRRR